MGGSVGKYLLMFTRIRDSGERDHNRQKLPLGLGADELNVLRADFGCRCQLKIMSAHLAHA